MCGFRDQTKVRSCRWRLDTLYQKLQIVILMWFLCLYNYHFVWGIRPSVLLTQSFVEKHILYIESSSRGTNHSIPFVYIKQEFDVVQDTPYFINQNGKNSRKRHPFLATSDIDATKEDLVLAFSDKVIRQVNKVRWTNTFVVYTISLKELRSHAVDAFDLDIKFDTMNFNYSIKYCKHSDSGTFNLGAEVKNWTAREYKINHVENVVLSNPKPCKEYPPQNPPGTCRN